MYLNALFLNLKTKPTVFEFKFKLLAFEDSRLAVAHCELFQEQDKDLIPRKRRGIFFTESLYNDRCCDISCHGGIVALRCIIQTLSL
jgi:hypothetical protein